MASNGQKPARANEIRALMGQSPEQPAPLKANDIRALMQGGQVATVATPSGVDDINRQIQEQRAISDPAEDFSNFDREPTQRRQTDPFLKLTQDIERTVSDVVAATPIGRVIDTIEGKGQQTEQIQGLPEIIGASMPGLDMARTQAIMTTITNPFEQQQALEQVLDNAEFKTDDKGVTIVEYDLPDGRRNKAVLNRPGFTAQDANQTMAQVLAFVPAARLSTMGASILSRLGLGAATSATTQATIEEVQTALGGTRDPGDVALATAAGVVGEALPAVAQGLPIHAPRQVAAQATQAAPEAIAREETEQLARTARKAVEPGIGKSRAVRTLEESAAPDPETLAAAERLGIQDHLQPDHVSTNQAFRELSQELKSIPGTQARAAEVEGFRKIAERSDEIIEELGGTTDLSQLDVNMRASIMNSIEDIQKVSDDIYTRIDSSIDPKTPAPANTLISLVNRKADELGGFQNLQPQERALLKDLAPRDGNPPTYALLENRRKQLTQARVRRQGPFADSDFRFISELEDALMEDQKRIIGRESPELLADFGVAQKSVAQRKAMENDIKSIFGKNLDGTILKTLSTSTKNLQKGDVSNFIKVVNALPKENRQELVASSLATAFGRNARSGNLSFNAYRKWYEGLQRNKQAMAALMTNLPKEARGRLKDLYTVSKGIDDAISQKIVTGRPRALQEEAKNADSLLNKAYRLALRGGAAESVTSTVGLPGVGMAGALGSALTKGKPDVVKAVDNLITSPEFIAAASKQTPEAAESFAKSAAFKRFANAAGNPRELSDPETWILSAFRAESVNEETE